MPQPQGAPARPAKEPQPTPARTPGLRVMLAGFFAVITAAPLTVGLLLVANQVGELLTDRAASELATSAQQAAIAVADREARVSDVAADLADLLVADDLAEALAEGERDTLDGWVSDRGADRVPDRADAIALIGPGGDVLASSGALERVTVAELAAAVEREEPLDGVVVAQREIRSAEPGDAAAADAQTDPAAAATIGRTVAASDLDADGVADRTGAEIAVLAGDGVVASSDPPPDQRPSIGEVVTVDADGTRMLATSATSAAGDLLVWRPARAGVPVAGLLALVAAPALVVAAALGWVLAGRVTAPVSRAAETARAVAAGDLERQVPSGEGPAEVRELADALNHMAGELSLRLQELESSREALGASLERVGETLASSLDLDRVLGVIAEAAADALRADGALIAVRDDDRLVVRGRYGTVDIPDAVPPPRVGEGIIGHVARSGSSLRVPPERIPPAAGEPPGACRLAVPLTVRGSAEGVLALLRDDATRPFDARAEALLGSFAAQASVALENVHRHLEAQEQAATDGLTGLANIRTLRATLTREVDAAERYHRPLSALAIDLDYFKTVNDRWGHHTGDRVLVAVAQQLSTFSRTADLVARSGGEEFVLLLPETGVEGAAVVAKRIRQAIAATTVTTADGVDIGSVTCSIGVASRSAGESGDALLRRADGALYEAKRAGRDRVITAEATAPSS